MNAESIRRNEAQLTSICRKVLNTVPTDEAMHINLIASELFRVTRSRVDKSVLAGCLNHLVLSGLIKERPHGVFRRIDATPPEQAPGPDPVDPVPEPPPVKPEPVIMRVVKAEESFLDKIARVACELRDASATMLKHAALIEDAAIEAQKAIDDEHGKNEKFDQLRKLLKGLE